MEQCYLLWTFQLPGGSCAQWFSGTASASAVAVAVGAHFYTAWRQRKSESRQDAAETAGISMILRVALNEAEANAYMFVHGCSIVTVWGQEYVLSKRLGAVKAGQLSALDKAQAELLIRSGEVRLAEKIDTLVGKTNLINLGIEDYSRLRLDLSALLDKHAGVDLGGLPQDGEEVRLLRKRMFNCSESAKHFLLQSRELFKEVIETVGLFNNYCTFNAFADYQIDTSWYENRLNLLETSAPNLSMGQ